VPVQGVIPVEIAAAAVPGDHGRRHAVFELFEPRPTPLGCPRESGCGLAAYATGTTASAHPGKGHGSSPYLRVRSLRIAKRNNGQLRLFRRARTTYPLR